MHFPPKFFLPGLIDGCSYTVILPEHEHPYAEWGSGHVKEVGKLSISIPCGCGVAIYIVCHVQQLNLWLHDIDLRYQCSNLELPHRPIV